MRQVSTSKEVCSIKNFGQSLQMLYNPTAGGACKEIRNSGEELRMLVKKQFCKKSTQLTTVFHNTISAEDKYKSQSTVALSDHMLLTTYPYFEDIEGNVCVQTPPASSMYSPCGLTLRCMM